MIAHLRRNAVAYAALVVALFTAGGVAYSAIPDGQGVVHGCYVSGGTLRVIDTEAGDGCRPSESALAWNQHGPAGPAGPAGAQGPAGVATTYARAVGGPVALKTGKPKLVASLSVPPGTYAVFAKAVGELTVPGFTCPTGTDVYYCVLMHNERRLAATIVGCAVSAGGASDLARANLIAGGNSLSAFQTISNSLVETLQGDSSKVQLRCLQYGGGMWDARLTNVRLVAMKIDPGAPPGTFASVPTSIPAVKAKPKLKPLRRVVK
jgi:hypothetical protein